MDHATRINVSCHTYEYVAFLCVLTCVDGIILVEGRLKSIFNFQ